MAVRHSLLLMETVMESPRGDRAHACVRSNKGAVDTVGVGRGAGRACSSWLRMSGRFKQEYMNVLGCTILSATCDGRR